MAKVKLYNTQGEKLKDLELSDSVFGLPKNDELVHQVFVSLMANRRQVLAHTKTRGERAGSGIKPWKQKGTGRARVGSVRTPLWRGGGVVFGPTKDRNFKKKINKKMNTKAIATTLSGKLQDGELIVLDRLELKENKTKSMNGILNNLSLKGKILMVFNEKERDLRMYSRNLKRVSNIIVEKLNVLDMLNNKNLVMSQAAALYLDEKYQQVESEKATRSKKD